jgi:hypothetical protein
MPKHPGGVSDENLDRLLFDVWACPQNGGSHVGLPYSFQGQMRNDEITGGSPYGASTIAGTKGVNKELAPRSWTGKLSF